VFERVLIANRGEIALRVARACHELGIQCVAVYSSADADSAVTRIADEAVHIGPPASGRSYLHIPSIIGAALKTGADAIHPGYGFLSEDPYFAEICAGEGITFIGPRPDVMEKVGDKATARELMQKAGLPLLPGTVDPVGSVDEAREIAESIGFPVIIKAVAGGGGRGMSVVWRREDLADLYASTRATAQAVFKDSAVYIERYLDAPRHTEVQLVCDQHGTGVYFGERDCSIQRRHQKLVEEAPSMHLTPEQRADIGAKAVAGALSVGYTGAGTMEFLLDHEGNLSFMEMNARIQVEHPVTEQVYGLDLVRLQIKLANGEKLERTQDSVVPRFHAIECRVNAEDPVTFAPSPGNITGLHQPGGYGVRVDTMAFEHYRVQPYYDSLVAKLICWADKREVALQRTRRALNEYVVEGIKTNIPFLRRVIADHRFAAGKYDTRLVEQILAVDRPAESKPRAASGT